MANSIIEEHNILYSKTNSLVQSFNNNIDILGLTNNKINISFLDKNSQQIIMFNSKFYITKMEHEFQIILGLPFLKTLHPNIYNLELGKYKLDTVNLVEKQKNNLEVCTILQDLLGFDSDIKEEKIQLLSETKQSKQLSTLLKKYRNIFTDNFTELPPYRSIDHSIKLIPNATFKKKPLFRLSELKQLYLRDLITKLLDVGFIRHSNSDITCNGFLVPKKPEGYRLCIDYVELNKNTVKNNYPIPRIEDLHDRLVGAHFFSKIDLQSGYYQIRMRDEDIHKTAFVTRYGSFEFLVMPFGLCNAPATFQQLMHEVLFDFLDLFVVVYLDDILIYSKSYNEHLSHINQVLNQLELNHLYINIHKSEFAKTKLLYLGFVVSHNGIETDDSKITAINDWPVPFNIIHDVRAFLGLSGYYRRFIKDYAKIVGPLTELLQIDSIKKWTNGHTRAVEQIKYALTHAPVLALPDYTKSFNVYTDASSYAIGAQLTQIHDNVERPIAFISRKLQGAQLKYSTYDKEMLAILFALEKWQVYLIDKEFIIYTDHKPLQYLQTQKVLNCRQQRWLAHLHNYKFIIRHIDGKKNTVADALSRRPDFESDILVNVVTEITDNGLKELILEEYKKYPNFINEEYLKNRNFNYYIDNELYYIPPKDINDIHKILIPKDSKDLQNIILYEYHNSRSSAHIGIYKTYKNISKYYHWVGLYQDLIKYLKSCEICQRSKGKTGKTYGLLQPLDIPEYPWQVITLDFVTNLPITQQHKNDTLLVVVDKFSKMARLIPLKQTYNAHKVAALFKNYIYKLHGIPKIIISDRDSRFTSLFWQALFASLDTQLKMSTAHHPQTDGQTEIMNKITQIMLRSVLKNKNIEYWDEYLADVEFAYNNTVHQSTGFTPFYMNYGRHPTTLTTIQHYKSVCHNKDARKFIENMKKIYEIATEKLLLSQQNQKKYADLRRQLLLFKKNEYALVSYECFNQQQQHKSKFEYQHIGPFKICKIVNDNAYVLYVTQNLGTYKTVNVSMLKRYIGEPTYCDVIHEELDIQDYIKEHDRVCKYHQETRKTRATIQKNILPSSNTDSEVEIVVE